MAHKKFEENLDIGTVINALLRPICKSGGHKGEYTVPDVELDGTNYGDWKITLECIEQPEETKE